MNPQPPVLETGALPIEPRPSGTISTALAYLFLGMLAQTKNCVGESSLDPFLAEQKPQISAPVMPIPT